MTKANIKQKGSAAMSISLLLVGVFVASSAGFGAAGDDESADYNYRSHETTGNYNHNNNNNNNNKLPVILMHKQSLQQDGGFQYAFAADNGLKQGESIRPDGSRTGAYSYTDPDGKEISVKYTAGKDGFRIIQGDHIPKAPVSVVPLQQHQTSGFGSEDYGPSAPGRSGSPAKNRLFSAPGGPGSQFSRGDFNNAGKFDSDEAYSPPSYKSKFSKPQHYRVREEISAEAPRYEDDGSSFDGAGDYSSHSPFRAPSTPAHAAAAYNGASANLQKNDGSYNSDSDERTPHTFGSGYAFEFAGAGGNNNGGASPEF